jgi:putative ABC transport system permease protein
VIFWNALALAFRQLGRNKTRTALTSLGVLIGVAAVIAMLGIGRGATRAVDADLAKLGENLLFVFPGTQGGPMRGSVRPFDERDVQAVMAEIPDVAAVAPLVSRSLTAAAGDATWRTDVHGSTVAYLRVLRWEIDEGRGFEAGEEVAGAEVCLLGATVSRELFGAQSPLGRSVRLGDLTCDVVGTLKPKGQSTFGQDQDDFVLIPLHTAQRRLAGSRDVGALFVSAAEGADTNEVKNALEALMRERRHIPPGGDADFVVRDMAEVASMLASISAVLTGFLAAIAGVSLLVGGIGIMNIMLVSVTERTREIGIRLAVGALARDVLLQFLVEAMVLSAVGGTLGIVVGLGLTAIAAAVLDIPFVAEPAVILLAFGFSAVIGVVFGFYPARRAARLVPIDALRHE